MKEAITIKMLVALNWQANLLFKKRNKISDLILVQNILVKYIQFDEAWVITLDRFSILLSLSDTTIKKKNALRLYSKQKNRLAKLQAEP